MDKWAFREILSIAKLMSSEQSRPIARLAYGSQNPVPSDDLKEMFRETIKITGIDFPNARFTGMGRKKVQSRDGLFEFSYSNGIWLLEGTESIPNIKRLVGYLKTKFGDVHVTRDDYINARGFGEEEEKDEVILPGTSSSLLSYERMRRMTDGVTLNEAMSVASDFREGLKKRKVKTKGRPKFVVLRKMKYSESILMYNGEVFYYDGISVYQAESVREAVDMAKSSVLVLNISRQAEVDDWKNQDFSSPTG